MQVARDSWKIIVDKNGTPKEVFRNEVQVLNIARASLAMKAGGLTELTVTYEAPDVEIFREPETLEDLTG